MKKKVTSLTKTSLLLTVVKDWSSLSPEPCHHQSCSNSKTYNSVINTLPSIEEGDDILIIIVYYSTIRDTWL